MREYKSEFTVHLDIDIADYADEFEGEIPKWQDILIHKDPKGFKSSERPLRRIEE